MSSPLCTIQLCLGYFGRTASLNYWINALGLQGFGWLCLGIAANRTRLAWKELPASARTLWWRQRWNNLRKGSPAARLVWRQTTLDKNPVGWLEGRDRLQPRILWAVVLMSAIFWALKHLQSPEAWPDGDTIILWPAWTHYLLCLWVALQAPRRMADDKHAGALELLLCTPITPTQIGAGVLAVLRHRFGRALVALMLLDAFLVYAYFSEHGGANNFGEVVLGLCICALIVFPIQTYSLALQKPHNLLVPRGQRVRQSNFQTRDFRRLYRRASSSAVGRLRITP